MDLGFDNWVAIVSVAIPSLAFLWEFAVVGRKRLGYRVQMDALAADATQSPYAGVLRDMQRDGHRLKDPSFVLLRIENAAAFLTYLTDQGGRDVLREYGNRLCSEVENPYVCEPT